jgi:hypothetical protein
VSACKKFDGNILFWICSTLEASKCLNWSDFPSDRTDFCSCKRRLTCSFRSVYTKHEFGVIRHKSWSDNTNFTVARHEICVSVNFCFTYLPLLLVCLLFSRLGRQETLQNVLPLARLRRRVRLLFHLFRAKKIVWWSFFTL